MVYYSDDLTEGKTVYHSVGQKGALMVYYSADQMDGAMAYHSVVLKVD